MKSRAKRTFCVSEIEGRESIKTQRETTGQVLIKGIHKTPLTMVAGHGGRTPARKNISRGRARRSSARRADGRDTGDGAVGHTARERWPPWGYSIRGLPEAMNVSSNLAGVVLCLIRANGEKLRFVLSKNRVRARVWRECNENTWFHWLMSSAHVGGVL